MYDATPAVELLERAVSYTRGALAGVRPELLCQPTPCNQWRLGPLLVHMADSLDALTEASSGLLPLTPVPSSGTDQVDVLKTKACALMGAWSSPAARSVLVGGHDLDARLLVGAGALEITLHGWDVGQATGARLPIPDKLAGALLPVARAVIDDTDRGRRFADPVTVPPTTSKSAQLLAFSGREPRLPQQSHP